MIKRLLLLILLLILAACQPDSAPQATVITFPTVTPGQSLYGVLSTPDRALMGDISNPATAVAQSFRPTATPNLGACPPANRATLPEDPPADLRQVTAVLVEYLNEGGAPDNLEDDLTSEWNAIGSSGFVRNDLDLTGEGTPEVMIAFTVPGAERGAFLVAGCVGGEYVLRYQIESDQPGPPELRVSGDMNLDGRPDLLLIGQDCAPSVDDEAEPNCRFQTQVISWGPELNRFISLMSTPIISDTAPEINDFDDDQVSEIVVRRTDDGDVTTGPLRTGTNIYDWNGNLYVLSITRLDPTQYRVQIIHEADRQFARRNMEEAITLYQESLANENLEDWFRDEADPLRSYAVYRLMLSVAFEGADADLIGQAQGAMQEFFPDPNSGPPYVEMADVFYQTYLQTGGDTGIACQEVLNVIQERPQALDLLNRYGSRSPTYTATDLCPF